MDLVAAGVPREDAARQLGYHRYDKVRDFYRLHHEEIDRIRSERKTQATAD